MARGRVTIEAGALVRGAIKHQIKAMAWTLGLEVEVEEDWGIFESLYRFTVTGSNDQVLKFKERFEAIKWEETE
jgi:hypothetical protein